MTTAAAFLHTLQVLRPSHLLSPFSTPLQQAVHPIKKLSQKGFWAVTLSSDMSMLERHEMWLQKC